MSAILISIRTYNFHAISGKWNFMVKLICNYSRLRRKPEVRLPWPVMSHALNQTAIRKLSISTLLFFIKKCYVFKKCQTFYFFIVTHWIIYYYFYMVWVRFPCTSAINKIKRLDDILDPFFVPLRYANYPWCNHWCNQFLMIGPYFLRSLPQVLIVHNVVPVKNAPGLVAWNHHGYPFRYPRPYHVPYGSSSKVMVQLSRISCLLTRGSPCPVEPCF